MDQFAAGGVPESAAAVGDRSLGVVGPLFEAHVAGGVELAQGVLQLHPEAAVGGVPGERAEALAPAGLDPRLLAAGGVVGDDLAGAGGPQPAPLAVGGEVE
ncbi:hypothetical protein [Endothiovibrio diazotrophicus]